MNKIPLTPNGKNIVEEELKNCKTVERPRIIDSIAEARAHGDLSENAEYHAAKEEQSHNETKIMELEDILSRAEVIDPLDLSGNEVKFSATILIVDEETDVESRYQIVGEIEADFNSGKISNKPFISFLVLSLLLYRILLPPIRILFPSGEGLK